MAQQGRPTFPHRRNRNGIVDSICSDCLVTIASAKDEDALAQLERAHVCDPVRLYQLGADPSRRFQIGADRLVA